MDSLKSKCLICEELYPQKGLAFFQFPKEESRLKMWVKEISPLLDILNIPISSVTENDKICARHFKENDFMNNNRDSLVQNACPSVEVSNQSMSYSENFYNANSAEEKSDSNDEQEAVQEGDTFQCGRCKMQFQLLSQFINHKRSQCELTTIVQDVPEKTAIAPENTPLPSSNSFFISFENKLPANVDFENKSEEMVRAVGGENEMVSYVVSDNGLLISNPSDMQALAGQVFLAPQLPIDDRTVFLNPTINNGGVDGFLVNADTTNNINNGEILFTCPIQNGSINNGLVLNSDVPGQFVNQVVLTTEYPNKSIENNVPDGSANFCDVGNSIEASQVQLLPPNFFGFVCTQYPAPENVGVVRSEETEKSEIRRTKTKLPCSYCGKVFEKPFNLQQHERVHTGERPFQCIICGRAFSQKSNVRKHMMRHKVWPKAKQTLKINDQNQQPLSQEVLEQMNYSCQYCSLSFKSYSLHKKHLTVHSNFKVYRCIQKGCDETFSDLDEFLSHSKMHSSAEFQCHVCLKAFTSLGELGAHQYDHDPAGRDKKDIEVKLKCEVCHAQFKTVESLKNHLAVDTHNYECPKCKSVFSSERFLRRHLVTHLDPSQSKYKCPNCKKTFRTQKYLNNHVFIHLKEKPFNCEHCGKQFASKYRLKRHLAIHLNQYLECPFKAYLGCDKTFYRKDKLRDHVTTHSHCRLRSCQVCSKTFSSMSASNQRTKNGDKVKNKKQVLKCMHCSQTFRKQKQLALHHCTVGEKKFRSKVRNFPSNRTVDKLGETVSNIEIIMVPCGSEDRNTRNNESLT